MQEQGAQLKIQVVHSFFRVFSHETPINITFFLNLKWCTKISRAISIARIFTEPGSGPDQLTGTENLV